MKCILVCEKKDDTRKSKYTASELAKSIYESGDVAGYVRVDNCMNLAMVGVDPFIYGEVYVLDDGTEVPKELGIFERKCSIKLTSNNYITFGSVLLGSIVPSNDCSIEGRLLNLQEAVELGIKQKLEYLFDQRLKRCVNGEWREVKPNILIVDVAENIFDDTSQVFWNAFVKQIDNLAESIEICVKGKNIEIPKGWKDVSFTEFTEGSSLLETPVEMLDEGCDSICIGIVSDGPANNNPYLCLEDSLKEAAKEMGVNMKVAYLDLGSLKDGIPSVNGLVLPGGFGSNFIDEKIRVIKHAREENIPFLGICLGFQLSIIEFFRSVLSIKTATSEEFSQNGFPVVIKSKGSKCKNTNREMYLGEYDVRYIGDGREIYRESIKMQKFRHSYVVNSKYTPMLNKYGLEFLGKTDNRYVMFKLKGHAFFCGVQYHPELCLMNGHVDEVFKALCCACIRN